MMEKIKILFTGGGTAGHVLPNIAVIEEIEKIAKRKDISLDILYVGFRNFAHPHFQKTQELLLRQLRVCFLVFSL